MQLLQLLLLLLSVTSMTSTAAASSIYTATPATPITSSPFITTTIPASTTHCVIITYFAMATSKCSPVLLLHAVKGESG